MRLERAVHQIVSKCVADFDLQDEQVTQLYYYASCVMIKKKDSGKAYKQFVRHVALLRNEQQDRLAKMEHGLKAKHTKWLSTYTPSIKKEND